MLHDVVFSFGSIAVTLGVSLRFVSMSMLVVAGALAWATIWFWRSARPEPEALAPLEIMGQRDFRSADEDTRKKMLNTVRAIPTIIPSLQSPVLPTVNNETK